MKDKLLSFLGIAKKAGKVIEGYNKCEETTLKNKCFLLIVSSNCALNTIEKFLRISEKKDIPMINHYSTEELSTAIGREGIGIIGISDSSIASKILELWKQGNNI
ncbi:ribosomal L7Ae/L30e/S12e/Gadd45 family protein [Clostridium peptidivorans]|uniref:ribosomal L7Ae/L30e/S12e/Gadd45 family protein n=1 Tax=Clostridium peptidivorans TaxID=100174 RepID=UPI000BE2F09C|nr:ribosomal L7Ae/L30e/S12e/Gadd45 family protein [Clostridium peptidivorans]